MTYEGWTNYETWAVKLWLDNEEWSYLEATQAARDAESVYDMAEWLKTFTDEIVCSNAPDSGLAADLFRAALSEVDWHEIAEAYVNDAKEESE